MLVIIANNLPPAVRGLLKVWCLEPKPHVFVTDLGSKSEQRIVKFLQPYFTGRSGLLVISSNKKSLQGFMITQELRVEKRVVTMSGLQLIEEREASPQST